MDSLVAIWFALMLALPASAVSLARVRGAGLEARLSVALLGGSALLFCLVGFSAASPSLGAPAIAGPSAIVAALLTLVAQRALSERLRSDGPSSGRLDRVTRFLVGYERVCRLAGSGEPEPARVQLVRFALEDLALDAPRQADALVAELALDVEAWAAGQRSTAWWDQRQGRSARRLADLLRPR